MHHRTKTEATYLVKRNRGLRFWGSEGICCRLGFIRLCDSKWLDIWDSRWGCSRWDKNLNYNVFAEGAASLGGYKGPIGLLETGTRRKTPVGGS